MSVATQQPPVSANIKKEEALGRAMDAGHWFLVDMVMQRVLVLGTFFVTAHLLTPADYGLIALAAIYPALLDSLTSVAFENALTQKKSGEETPYLNVVWTFSVLRYALLFFIVFLTAPLAAMFFHSIDATLLFRLGGLYLLFQGFTNIGQIYFFRELDFKKVFLRDAGMYGTNVVVTLITAYFFRTYWAIFAGSVSSIVASTIASYILHSYRPRFDFSFKKLIPLIPYSRWVFGQGMVNRLTQTIENVLIGHFSDAASVGLYGKAKNLSQAPTSPLGNIISKIGFSALVSVQDSKAYVSEGFHKSVELTATISLAFLLAIFLGGHQLVLIVLGEKWLGITPFLRILTVAATLDALVITIAGTIMNAVDKPRLLFELNTCAFVSLGILLPILIPIYGTYGAAIALVITAIITNTWALLLIRRVIAIDWKRIAETFTVIIIGLSLPLLMAIWLLRFEFTNTRTGFLILVAFTGLIYGGLIYIAGRYFQKGPYGTLLVIIRSFHKKLA